MSRVIDGIIKEWGDRLYYPSIKVKGRNYNVLGGSIPAPKKHKKSTLSLNQKLFSTVKKAPEVMVKISGSGKNMKRIGAHMDYISRKGEVELEDENGDIHSGKDAVKEVKDSWAQGRIGIPAKGERRREAFNIVLSMPPGTDRFAVKSAARNFASERFSDHQYVFAAHDDEKHPHIHLAVKAVNRKGIRLNPRKADLQKWREHFAVKLRDQGIIANATPRRARGIVRKGKNQIIHHIEKRGSASLVLENQRKDVLMDIKTGSVRENPAKESIEKSRHEIVQAYKEISKILLKSKKREGKEIARDLSNFVKDLPLVKTKHQVSVEFVMNNTIERGNDKQVEGKQGKDRVR